MCSADVPKMLGKEVCQSYVGVHELLEINAVKCEAMHEHGHNDLPKQMNRDILNSTVIPAPFLHSDYFSAYSATVLIFSPLAHCINLFKLQLESAWEELFA